MQISFRLGQLIYMNSRFYDFSTVLPEIVEQAQETIIEEEQAEDQPVDQGESVFFRPVVEEPPTTEEVPPTEEAPIIPPTQ